MKKTMLILMMLFICAAAVAASQNFKGEMKKSFSDCQKSCTGQKQDSYLLCKSDFKVNSTQSKIQYNSCKADSNTTNLTEKRMLLKGCSYSYADMRKTINRERTHCLQESVNAYHICKENCSVKKALCIDIYEPVCGKDGKTYSNECFLNLSGVKKQSDGICPETCKKDSDCPKITCIKGPCPQPKCHDGACIAANIQGGSCKKDRDCNAFFSHCSCSWSCVRDVPKVDCAMACSDEMPAKPSCGCVDGYCGLE